MKDAWLRCKVFKGMFSDEVAIKYWLKGGDSQSVFVPRSLVTGELEQDGLVKVQVFRQGDNSFAVLPTEYRDNILVRDEDLVSA